MSTEPLSRRTILKGAGVALCLPLLEAMTPTRARAGRRQEKPPIRLAALYMPNGVNPMEWTPAGEGKEFALSSILAPLEALKSEILVLTGLMNHQSLDGDGHYAKVAPFLTGTHITKTTGSNLRCGGISLDQFVAQRIGNLTPLPSLELSVEPVTAFVDANVGFTALYGSHISWSSPTTPVTREINPQMAFDRLFRAPQAAASALNRNDGSILDAVLEDANALSGRVGTADKQKLQEYYDAVRGVEKRIAFDAMRRAHDVKSDPLARREVEKLGGRIRDYYSVPEGRHGIDHTEQVRLMLDMMVLAFWTDTTRVATFMFGNEVTGKNFSFLEGVSGGHHEISHHQGDKGKLEEYRRINVWHLQQYAYMLEKMRGIREGAGTLLDNSLVLLGGGIRDGNSHDPHNLPIVLAGRGGKLATGRHLVFPKETPLCNLYRSLLTCLELPAPAFGDSVGELTGLA